MKPFKIAAVVFTLVILLSAIAGCTTTTPTSTTTTIQMTTYADTSGLFTVAYPLTWEISPTLKQLQSQISTTLNSITAGTPLKNSSVVFISGLKADVGYYPNINISVDPVPNGLTTIDQAAQLENEVTEKAAPDFQEVARTKKQINGKDVIIVEFTATFTGAPMMYDYMLVYLSGSYIWTMTCTAKETDFSLYKNDFNAMINSLNITK